jgi:KDO2-lipid IV(A) lauroyltransferase
MQNLAKQAESTQRQEELYEDIAIPWKKLSWSQIFNGLLDTSLHWIMRALPIEVCSVIGSLITRHLLSNAKGIDARIKRNIRVLKPGISCEELKAITRKWWNNKGRTTAEFSVLRRIWKTNRVTIQGRNFLSSAKLTGRPLIFLLLHTGNWEVLGQKLIKEGFIVLHTYQSEGLNPFHRKIAANIRRPYKKHLITNNDSAVGRTILRRLTSGECLVIAMDLGAQFPSLGRPLPTKGNLVQAIKLAKLSNAVLVPTYALRTKGARFDLHTLPHIELDFNGFNRQKLHEAVGLVDRTVEPIIRQHFDQWDGLSYSELSLS